MSRNYALHEMRPPQSFYCVKEICPGLRRSVVGPRRSDIAAIIAAEDPGSPGCPGIARLNWENACAEEPLAACRRGDARIEFGFLGSV